MSLEDLYSGCTKTVVHNRTVFNDGGEAMTEVRRLAVQIEPGMPDGTTFVFQG